MKIAAFKKKPLVIGIGVILLLVAAMIAFGLFIEKTVYFEGIASITFLIIGLVFCRVLRKELVNSGTMAAAMIVIFAIFGMIFDGARNFIYNKPLELAFCPAETELTREVTFYENSDGEEVPQHNFACFSASRNQTVKEIPRYFSLGLRFFEYVLLGLILLGIVRLSARFENPKNQLNAY